MASGFYTVYALKELGAPDSAVGTFTLVLMAAQTVGMLAFGFLADRHGHLIVLTIGALASGAASLAALGATSLALVYVVFVFYGLSIGATNVSGMPIGLEFGPEEERPTYVAITNSSRAPFALVGPLVGARWPTRPATGPSSAWRPRWRWPARPRCGWRCGTRGATGARAGG